MMYKYFVKRFIDITLSLFAIIIFFPFLTPVIIGLLLTGENYVFYFQDRIGFKNKNFKIIKFATMLKDSPNLGSGIHTTKNDPRILPLGTFLRKTKINELPQLINILIGDMSIIGPRPLVKKTFDPYSDEVKSLIYNVKPGLSGIGSIVFRNEEDLLANSQIPMKEFYETKISPYKGRLELWYQKNLSFYTDFMIIIMTLITVVRPNDKLIYKVFKSLPKK